MLKTIKFGRNSAKLLAISLTTRKLQFYNFCFADLLVHDIQEVKRLQAGFVHLFRLETVFREGKIWFCVQDPPKKLGEKRSGASLVEMQVNLNNQLNAARASNIPTLKSHLFEIGNRCYTDTAILPQISILIW